MTVREKYAFDPSSLPDPCEPKLLSSWESTSFFDKREAIGSNSWQQPLLQQNHLHFLYLHCWYGFNTLHL